MQVHTRAQAHAPAHEPVYTRTHARTHAHTHTHTHTRARAHTHTHHLIKSLEIDTDKYCRPHHQSRGGLVTSIVNNTYDIREGLTANL